MSQVSIDTDIATLETVSCSGGPNPLRNLRGVRWRIDLGILPSYPSASVDDLRRVTADSRRRYAAVRRQLLVDPHVPKDGGGSPDHFMDNPLSQNPDSTWGRFFRNAELERIVDQDLTRLYPERSSYFQTSECQGILRRILLLWCIRHPEYGYRQGMHELLAPLLYVLHVDVEHLSEVKKTYADHFADKFDGFSYYENDLTYKFDFKKFSDSVEDGNGFKNTSSKASSPSELDPEVQTIVLLNDAYGAEGELGIVLSEKFMEHDAYSMFDSLMCGSGGSIAMAEFFSPSPFRRSRTTGSPPVIEASAAIYHLLSIIDSSLHTHLVELEVEPQYFALRWLRVLFGREFSLEDLLVIWDEIFTCGNTMSSTCDAESNFALLDSPRGAVICSFAVSMILNLRSSLLATENATICLQRLLNFPDDVKLAKLLAKAKSLHSIATDANNLTPISVPSELYNRRKSTGTRGHSLSMDSSSTNPLIAVPDSYWEEKWRVLHKEEENKQVAVVEQIPTRRKGWSERVKLRLSRTESDPSPSKKNERTKIVKPSVRRSLLNDLARQLGLDENHKENTVPVEDVGVEDSVEVNREDLITEETYDNSSSAAGSEENSNFSDPSGFICANYEGTEVVKPSVRRSLLDDLTRQLGSDEEYRENIVSDEDVVQRDIVEVNRKDTYENSSSAAGSEENSSDFSDPTGPIPENSDNENESESSVASNSSIDENDTQMFANDCECSPLPISTHPDGASSEGTGNDDSARKLATGKKEIKQLSGKFQWLWKFGRNGNEGTSDRNAPKDAKACKDGSDQNNLVGISTADGCNRSSVANKGETVDQNLMVSFKNLGQSMIENIQVLESIFQQDRGQVENSSKNGLVGKGQVTATVALKELRKISHLLSEM